MSIFRRESKKNSKPKKKSLQEWLEKCFEKLIAPETVDRIKSIRPGKIKSHTHNVEGVTARAKGHRENVAVVTGNPIKTKDGHVHEYGGDISGDGRQEHCIEGVTSSAAGSGREHTHQITGRTSKDGNHAHKYSMETSNVLKKKEGSKLRLLRKPVASSGTASVLPVEPN